LHQGTDPKDPGTPDNFIPGHRVENCASYCVDALFVGFAALQLYFNDRHELGIELFKLLVGHQFYLGALADNGRIPPLALYRARRERKRSCRRA
jgi:hypothetical protein